MFLVIFRVSGGLQQAARHLRTPRRDTLKALRDTPQALRGHSATPRALRDTRREIFPNLPEIFPKSLVWGGWSTTSAFEL